MESARIGTAVRVGASLKVHASAQVHRGFLGTALLIGILFAGMSPAMAQDAFLPAGADVWIVSDMAAALDTQKKELISRNPEAAEKLWGELLGLMDQQIQLGSGKAREYADARGIEMAGDAVTVIAGPASGVSPDGLADAIEKAGAVTLLIGDSFVKAIVPMALLEGLATGVPEVGYVRLPIKPHLDNTVISEGINNDTVTNARNWQDHGFRGAGVRVAVIDGGFIGLALRKAADEIPVSAVEVDYTGSGMESGTDHGCAVAEIVYDTAPNAQLYLIKVSDETDLQQAEVYCRTNGIRVINHSMGWYGFNFFDGVIYSSMSPAPISNANDANANGILWVNSAGNDRRSHVLIPWTDANSDNTMDWTPTYGNVNQIGNLSANTPVVLKMTWNAWPTTNQDFDLLLVRWTGSAWETVASSQLWQTGTQPPTEQISYTVPSSKTGTHGFVVAKYSATTSPTFIVRAWYQLIQCYSYNNTTTPVPGSIGSPADAASVFGVGAISWTTYRTGPMEVYSSLGPNNRAYTGGSALPKPDICGPDANSGVTYGNYPTGFTGTSASSPHVAALAALVWSRFPSFTNAQVRSYLETGGSNPDLGTVGKDNTYGYGPCVLTKVWSISGYVRDGVGVGIGNVLVSATNGGGAYTTAADGYYALTVSNGWSGTVTPTRASYAFTPPTSTYTSLGRDETRDYVGSPAGITISGHVRDSSGNGIQEVVMTGLPCSPTPVTDANGDYECSVPTGWSGTVRPTKACYTFSPVSKAYYNVTSNQTQDYVGTRLSYTISGYVRTSTGAAIAGVVMNGLPCSPTPITNTSGYYTCTVPCGWSGMVTPTKACYVFNVASRTYSNVTANQTNQNYTGTALTYKISGRVVDASGNGILGVKMTGLPGNPVTPSTGAYSATVPCGWSGTVTPTKACYAFTPPSIPYSNVSSDQTQDYVGRPANPVISGRVKDSSGNGIPDVIMNGLPGNPVTGPDGTYSAEVSCGWSGTVRPTKACYTFSPVSKAYYNVTSNQTQDYVGTRLSYTISGYVRTSTGAAIAGVVMNGLPCSPTPITNTSGYYTCTVPCGWSGMVTPAKIGYAFTPTSRSYSNVTVNQTYQNYVGH